MSCSSTSSTLLKTLKSLSATGLRMRRSCICLIYSLACALIRAYWNDDINARPLYANWRNTDILVNLHTNGGRGTGTETWYDTGNGQQTNSHRLATNIQNNVVNIIRNNYNPNWTSRGVKGGNQHGENRWATRPSVIVEAAFHDKDTPDNAALKDERFKRLVGQGICNGILAYFGQSGTCGDGNNGGGGNSGNLARGRSAYASSWYNSTYAPFKGNDGYRRTRWSSRASNNLGYQYWYTNLGRQQTFNRVTVRWNNAYARSYYVMWSNNGRNWSGYRYNISSGGTRTHNIGSRNAKYVGLYMLTPAPHINKYSFWEFEVYRMNGRSVEENEHGILEALPIEEEIEIELPFDDQMIEEVVGPTP